MLSTNAFNALLKIMEEPPSYIKFILATTEVHRSLRQYFQDVRDMISEEF